MKKKLSEEKIILLENWAEQKKGQVMSDEEKKIVQTIENYKNNDWKGIRVEKTHSIEIAKKNLEKLKRRRV